MSSADPLHEANDVEIEVLCLSHSPAMNGDTEKKDGKEFRAGVDRMIEAVHRYDPTLVVMFGSDHRRALTDVAPSMTVATKAHGFGDWDIPTDAFDIPAELAAGLVNHLIDDSLDIAIGRDVRLDHGFGLSFCQLFDGLAAVPSLPILLNAIGTPRAPMSRVAHLGRSVGRFLRAMPTSERVLVLGSGGLSHDPPFVPGGAARLPADEREALFAVARKLVKPDFDRRVMDLFAKADFATLETMSDDELAAGGSGAHEVRNWFAAAVVGDGPLRPVVYEPVPNWFTGMGVSASERLAA